VYFSFSFLRGKEKEKYQKKEKHANNMPKRQGSALKPASYIKPVFVNKINIIRLMSLLINRKRPCAKALPELRPAGKRVFLSFGSFSFFASISKKENERHNNFPKNNCKCELWLLHPSPAFRCRFALGTGSQGSFFACSLCLMLEGFCSH